MLILLPPSETKRPGGAQRPLDLAALAFPQLRRERESVVSALVTLSGDEDAASRILKLSERQRGEIALNASVREAPTMAAVDRYTGVLYDALDADRLDGAARRWLGSHVLIQSAPFGPVGALDRIPSYRLSAGASLPGIPPLRSVWAGAVEAALSEASARFILDLRSEAYAALGPVPPSTASVYVRVVADTGEGAARALNHFNKHAKGVLVRELALARPRIDSAGAFRVWAASAGWRVEIGEPGELRVFVRHP